MGVVTELKSRTETLTKDGDGDGGDFVQVEGIVIKSVSNGWVITTYFEGDEKVIEVFDTDGNDNGNLQAIKCIIESMGIGDEIKIK